MLELAAPEGIEPPTPSLGLKKNRLKNLCFESADVSGSLPKSMG
jgi:hypothetical protein